MHREGVLRYAIGPVTLNLEKIAIRLYGDAGDEAMVVGITAGPLLRLRNLKASRPPALLTCLSIESHHSPYS